MRCPTLAMLPPPLPGKTGWPWTVGTPQLPPTRPDGSPWPRISIITPSYNQGEFIEETIRSVLLQGYPNLEYIVIDGGSTDESVQIIKKYESWLAYWTSETDNGQADAINKGFAKASGQIGAYLNSDDYYFPNVLSYTARSLNDFSWDLLIGRSGMRYSATWRWLRRSWWRERLSILPRPFVIGGSDYAISQELTFWNLNKGRNYEFDERFHFCLDVDWYCRIARGSKIVLTSKRIGYFRQHPHSKTATLQHIARSEIEIIIKEQEKKGVFHSEAMRLKYLLNRNMAILFFKRLVAGVAEFSYLHPS